jgi:hypothetical protein
MNIRRRRPNLKRALALMAQADAYCAEHGHNWQQGEPGRRICPHCGLERAVTNADVEADLNAWNLHVLRSARPHTDP